MEKFSSVHAVKEYCLSTFQGSVKDQVNIHPTGPFQLSLGTYPIPTVPKLSTNMPDLPKHHQEADQGGLISWFNITVTQIALDYLSIFIPKLKRLCVPFHKWAK